MTKPFIDRAYLLEPHPVVTARIHAARPDIEIIDAPAGTEIEPEGDFAIVGFGGGAHVQRFRAAKWVHNSGAGIDKQLRYMDFTPPVLTRTLGTLGQQMAEYVLAYYLRDTQKLDLRDRLQADSHWDNKAAQGGYAFTQRALIFGTGPMGATIAQYLKGLGLETTGVARSEREIEGFDRVITLDRLAEIVPEGLDLVVMVLPDTASTRGMVGAPVLSQFRGTLLINVGRGPSLPEKDLLVALEAGHVRHAVLDVMDVEPLPADSPLWSHPKITVTPHVSGGTRPEDIADAFLQSLSELEEGKKPSLWIDPK